MNEFDEDLANPVEVCRFTLSDSSVIVFCGSIYRGRRIGHVRLVATKSNSMQLNSGFALRDDLFGVLIYQLRSVVARLKELCEQPLPLELGRVPKGPTVDIIVSFVKGDERQAQIYCDIRQFVAAPSFTGWTRKGLRFPVSALPEFYCCSENLWKCLRDPNWEPRSGSSLPIDAPKINPQSEYAVGGATSLEPPKEVRMVTENGTATPPPRETLNNEEPSAPTSNLMDPINRHEHSSGEDRSPTEGKAASHLIKERLTKLFEYLQAFTGLKYPPRRDIETSVGYLWIDDLPNHDTIRIANDTHASAELIDDGVVLRIERATSHPCPSLPRELVGWLKPGWNEPNLQPAAYETRPVNTTGGRQISERFDASRERRVAMSEWLKSREMWAEREGPVRKSLEIFQKIYEWYGVLQRDGERIELLIGDGIVHCANPNEDFYHPILLNKLELEFDPKKERPVFTIRKRNLAPELLVELLRSIPGADGEQLSQCVDELKKAEFSPLGGADTDGFLRRLVQGVFSIGSIIIKNASATPLVRPERAPEHPTVYRRPVLFLRERRSGRRSIIELILEDIRNRESFSPALLSILGFDEKSESSGSADRALDTYANEAEDVLFCKPANREQLQIARQLEQRDSVIVQGPPGTGKTHTIANLLGHLLAHGMRVLVTAHTPKALRVLREKLPASIQPLCLSLLENDKKGQTELQDSVRQIHARLSQDERELEQSGERLKRERLRLIGELRAARKLLFDARLDEIRDVVIEGYSLRPVEAARFVRERSNDSSWIPEPADFSRPMPLEVEEISDLYRITARVKIEDEAELARWRPDIAELPTPEVFRRIATELDRLSAAEVDRGAPLWENESEESGSANLEQALAAARKAAQFLEDCQPWMLAAVQAGLDGGPSRKLYESLITLVEQSSSEIQECTATIIESAPTITGGVVSDSITRVIEEIHKHHVGGGRFGLWTWIRNRSWFRLKQTLRIGRSPFDPADGRHVHSARALVRIQALREELTARWDRQLGAIGAPSSREFGDQPEEAMMQYLNQIRQCLLWHEERLIPAQRRLEGCGFRWQEFIDSAPPANAAYARIARVKSATLGELAPIIAARRDKLEQRRLEGVKLKWLSALSGSHTPSSAASRARAAIQSNKPDEYASAYYELLHLDGLAADAQRRSALLERLAGTALGWANALKCHTKDHDGGAPPGDPAVAWKWKQVYYELERRAAVSVPNLQERVDQLSEDLLRVTTDFIEVKTWLFQIRNTTSGQRRSLGAFAAMIGKITKSGRGVRDAEFRRAARNELAIAREVVPVWVMSLAEVAENFDPKRSRFDVVIIDEASQCDPSELFALYLGRKVLVVGDDEQVTPTAVGESKQDEMTRIQTLLKGIPHKELYGGTTSVYELAQFAFGRLVRLVEHFRCAPNIIQFSNQLSYDLAIKPLREASSVPLVPHVVPYRVEGGENGPDNVNKREAEMVAALVCAAIKDPTYELNHERKPSSFGVISMVGSEQALYIDSILRRRLDPAEYVRHRVLCGDAAQFQGDERDVMFLSMVDSSPEEPPLFRRQDGPQKIFKKRFNVAASRARNQMWVVYSLNYDLDLKPGDIRRQLIEHAIDPESWQRQADALLKAVDPRSVAFEGAVARKLAARGYTVLPQYSVGAYRIDLVVRGNNKSIAIECDGERFHGPEKLMEDIERQSILERQGWRFIRIRGSLFFRDEDRAMEAVFRRLDALGVEPESSAKPDSTRPAELVERVVRAANEIRAAWTVDQVGG